MNEVNTFVFRGRLNPENGKNPFYQKFCGLTPSAWSRGEALVEKEELEDFVRKCAIGDYVDIGDAQFAAQDLMSKQGFA